MNAYQPLIDAKEAFDLLTLRGRFFRWKKTLPKKLELIYLPYYFFQLRVKNKKGEERRFLAGIDAVSGSFALVDDKNLKPGEISEIEFSPQLEPEQAEELILKEARWFLYQKSLQERERYQLVSWESQGLFYYPYWVGYYQNPGRSWDFLALDAVSGILQGGPARRIFILAFSQFRVPSSA